MEQLPGGRRPRLVSSLGLGQRSWEVTLDEERGRLAWRDLRPPRRGGGEWSGAERRAGPWRAGGRPAVSAPAAAARGAASPQRRGKGLCDVPGGVGQRGFGHGRRRGRPAAGPAPAGALPEPVSRRRRAVVVGSEHVGLSERRVSWTRAPFRPAEEGRQSAAAGARSSRRLWGSESGGGRGRAASSLAGPGRAAPERESRSGGRTVAGGEPAAPGASAG